MNDIVLVVEVREEILSLSEALARCFPDDSAFCIPLKEQGIEFPIGNGSFTSFAKKKNVLYVPPPLHKMGRK